MTSMSAKINCMNVQKTKLVETNVTLLETKIFFLNCLSGLLGLHKKRHFYR